MTRGRTRQALGDAAASLTQRLKAVSRQAREPALWALLILSLAVLAQATVGYVEAVRQNRVIDMLAAGKDVAIDIERAPEPVLLARSRYLLFRDRIDEAQVLGDVSLQRVSPGTQAALLYNLGNARLRRGVAAVEAGTLDVAIAQVNLAKAAYRRSLRADAGDWNAKYNLDVAMRLVRDLPRGDGTDDEDAKDESMELWTDLPGVPKGLP